MRSKTCNNVQEREKEKVCCDMKGNGDHVTVVNMISYSIFVCFYIDMCGCGRKRKDMPCNHEESINFLCQDNPSYFTTTYINGNKSWPRSCFHCSIEFGSGYKVNNKHPVMMCENAAKHEHECMCAMCINCYNKMQSNEEYPSRRTRRSRNK